MTTTSSQAGAVAIGGERSSASPIATTCPNCGNEFCGPMPMGRLDPNVLLKHQLHGHDDSEVTPLQRARRAYEALIVADERYEGAVTATEIEMAWAHLMRVLLTSIESEAAL